MGEVQGPALGSRLGSRGRSPRENLGFYAILGVGERGFSGDFLKQKSSRPICGLISLSYRHDNLVPGRFIGTSYTIKTSIPVFHGPSLI